MGLKVSEILEGWRNTIIPPEKIREAVLLASKYRLDICSKCEWHSKNNPKASKLRPDDYCTKCGCTLFAKANCLSCKCPLDPPKWDKVQE